MMQSQWKRDDSERGNGTEWPFISVIVPVRNEEKAIRGVLLQLLEQRYPKSAFEVIVADGESTDQTVPIIQALQKLHPNLYLVSNPGVWSSAGRNAAIEMATGDIILLVDGHCDLDNPEYFADLADAFERSGADCIGRPQPLDISEASPVQQAIAIARASRFGHHPDSWIYADTEAYVRPQSVAIAYRREVFDRVGTFDESFDACEDVELNHRVDQAGLTCFFTPRAQVKYHPRSNLRGLFRQMRRYGRGRLRLLRKHPGSFSLPGFIPAFFVLGLILGPILACVSPLCSTVFLSTIALYGALTVLFSLGLGISTGRYDLLPYFPMVFPTIHFGAGMGIILEAIKPGKRPERQVHPIAPESTAQPRRAA